MSSFLDLSLRLLMSIGMNWYESTFMVGLSQLPSVLLSFLLSYLVIQLFFFIFPPIRKLGMIIGAPFRYMHVWFHVNKARQIERKKYGIIHSETKSPGFWGENKGDDMIPLLHTYFTTMDALKIAFAPVWGAIALFVFLIISSPIFAALGVFGFVLHIYILFGCFGIVLPSLKDFTFLLKGNTSHSLSLHPGYIVWAYFIFAFSGYIALQQGASALVGFKEGIFYALAYIVLVVVVSKIKRKSHVTS